MIRKGASLLGGITIGASGVFIASDERAKIALFPPGDSNGGGLVRFGRTAFNVAITAADYKYSLYGLDKEIDQELYKKTLHDVNIRAANRLFKVCHLHGGLYTKLGQSIANLNHALPAEFVNILAPLQDKAKEMPIQVAMEAIKEELGGKDVNDVFEYLDPKPMAAASLAQVHEGVLKDSGGTRVAVKIQYPYLRDQAASDLATLGLVTDFIGYWFPEFSYSWLSPEFENNMNLELNFIQEGRNGDRVAKMFAHRSDVKVPKVYWDYTTERLLVMEFVDMIKITNIQELERHGINPIDVAKTTSSVFGEMVHVHGFCHCDLHPGNLGVEPVKQSWFSSIFGSIGSGSPSWSSILSSLGYLSIIGFVTVGSPGSSLALVGAQSAIGLVAMSGVSSLFSTSSGFRGHSTSYGGKDGNQYKLVVLDHGMYRRLDPDFRQSYCLLWKSLLLRDVDSGRVAATELGVPAKQYDILSMIFTFRSPTSSGATGQRMSKEERKRIRAQFADTTAGDVNTFLQGLPRDLLFVMRSTNIVRSINLALGGTTRLRFKLMGESAVRGLLVPNPSAGDFEMAMEEALESHVPHDGPYVINMPVASEIVDADTVTLRQRFEIWKLDTYLELIDNSWGLLAKLVKLL